MHNKILDLKMSIDQEINPNIVFDKIQAFCKSIDYNELLQYHKSDMVKFNGIQNETINRLLINGQYFSLVYSIFFRRIPILGKLIAKKFNKNCFIEDKNYYSGKSYYYFYIRSLGHIEDCVVNIKNYKWVIDKLEENESKLNLCYILLGHLLNEKKYFELANNSDSYQYFDNRIINFESNEVIVDCGGYIGDTAMVFFDNYPNMYTKYYLYEPDDYNLNISKKNLKNNENIIFKKFGVSDTNKIVRFNSGNGPGGEISDKGSEEIQVVMLDTDISEKVTFIKMDIEGEEHNAIIGSMRHIKEERPKMAICVYHKPGDIWDIAKLIDLINNQYTFFLRHYTNNQSETVLYCI